MTVSEAVGLYGYSTTKVNYGETLTSLCRRLYQSDDDKYLGILKELNVRYDWDSLEPGDEIRFLQPEDTEGIEEIW